MELWTCIHYSGETQTVYIHSFSSYIQNTSMHVATPLQYLLNTCLQVIVCIYTASINSLLDTNLHVATQFWFLLKTQVCMYIYSYTILVPQEHKSGGTSLLQFLLNTNLQISVYTFQVLTEYKAIILYIHRFSFTLRKSLHVNIFILDCIIIPLKCPLPTIELTVYSCQSTNLVKSEIQCYLLINPIIQIKCFGVQRRAE